MIKLSFDKVQQFQVAVPVFNDGGGYTRHAAVEGARFVAALDRSSVAELCPNKPRGALADRLASETIYAHLPGVLTGRVDVPARVSTKTALVGIVGSVRYVSDVEHVWHCVTFAAKLPAPLDPETIDARDGSRLGINALAPLDTVGRLTLAD